MPERWITVNDLELQVTDYGYGHPLLLCPGGPGHGDYLGPVADLVDDMEAPREVMGFKRWVGGGHSFGTFLALAYSLEYPDRVDGTVYLAGTGVQNDRDWHIAYADARDTAGELEPEFTSLPNMDVNRALVESARAYYRDPFLLQRIAALQTPLLAVAGVEDIRPNWPAEQMVHLMPNGGIVMLPEAGHYPWLAHAESLRAVMRGFLQ